MKFVRSFRSEVAGRRSGEINFQAFPLQTPACMSYTRIGHIPHVLREVAETYGLQADKRMYQLNLSTLGHLLESLQSYTGTLHKFLGIPENASLFMSLHDPYTLPPSGGNTKNYVKVGFYSGHQSVDSKKYFDLLKPVMSSLEAIQCLYDGDTGSLNNQSSKRVAKAVNRNLSFLRTTIQMFKENNVNGSTKEVNIIASLEGGYSRDERERCVRETLQTAGDYISGFSIEGFHSYGKLMTDDDFDEVVAHVKHTLSLLPEEKMRIVQGIWTPQQMMRLINIGIDLFDSSYVYYLTEQGAALVVTENKSGLPSTELIDLSNSQYFSDLTPLVRHCSCPTCTGYTKAYLHHLFNTKELEFRVLVMGHNLHHFEQLFHIIRKHIPLEEVWREF